MVKSDENTILTNKSFCFYPQNRINELLSLRIYLLSLSTVVVVVVLVVVWHIPL